MAFPLVSQYQQQPLYGSSRFYVEEQMDPSSQLLMIGQWSNDLAVRLQELHGQLAFTVSSVDPRSPQWLEFHLYLAQQFELISAGLETHRSWLDHLQRMQHHPVRQDRLDQHQRLQEPQQEDLVEQDLGEQAATPTFDIPQTQSMSQAKLQKLNDRLEVAHEESKTYGQREN